MKVARPRRQATRHKRAEFTPEGVTIAGSVRLYDLSAYRPELEGADTDWMIKNWLVRGQIHQFVGEEKRGKSTQQWRRIAAVSRGDSYLGEPARRGRVVAVTEMGPDVIRALLDDDDIEPDLQEVRVVLVDELDRTERLSAIGAAIKSWQPVLLALDPIDECMGLDEKGIFNSSTTADGFQVLRRWANEGLTIDALYHFNHQGGIANSYKFRAKPDHLYRIRGAQPSDVTYEYQGRVRAIPRKRRIVGNGDDGYEVSLLVAGATGRPAKTRLLIVEALRASTVPLSIAELARQTDTPYPATKQAVFRAVKKGQLEQAGQGYRLKDGYETTPYIRTPLSVPMASNEHK